MYLKLHVFPLHLAIMTRNEDISDTLKLLVTSQENILSILTWRDIEGRTPLHIASTHNGTQGLKLLELVGPENRFAIAKQINIQGQSVLHVAATNLESVSYILSMLISREQHDLLMLRDCRGRTMLHVKNGLGLITLSAISNTMDLSAERITSLLQVRDDMGNTALHLGLAVESVSVLPGISKRDTHCDIQAPFTVRNDDGFSPLHWAMSRIMAPDHENLCFGHFTPRSTQKIMQIQLTETSRFYKHVDYKGDTILHTLAVRQSKDHLEMILSNVTLEELESLLAIQNDQGNTALHMAAHSQRTFAMFHPSLVAIAIESASSASELLKLSNGIGCTVLHVIAYHSELNIVKTLLSGLGQASAFDMMSVSDQDGNTPLHVAAALEKFTMVLYMSSRLNDCDRKRVAEIKNAAGENIIDKTLDYNDQHWHRCFQQLLGSNKMCFSVYSVNQYYRY